MTAEVSPFVALAAVLIVVFVLGRINRSRRYSPAKDDPAQEYSVFTREFDVTCAGRDLGSILVGEGAQSKFPSGTHVVDPLKRREVAEQAYRSAREQLALSEWKFAQVPGEVAVAFLVDQSGSMRNRMPEIAGALKAVIEQAERLGISTALLGFTTAGWRGGKVREFWKQQGRPTRPGRLCALLHVVYKKFGEPMADQDWQGLLQAAALRENVDGEALEWAVETLKTQDARQRILIVLSDGAPVDDSTLMENGTGFLWRHFTATVAEIAKLDSVSLGAIGIEHSVDEVYPASVSVSDLRQVPQAIEGLLSSMLA